MKKYLALTEEERKILHEKFLQNPDSFYAQAEENQLRAALNRTDKERFLMMTQLMKTHLKLSKAKITFSTPNAHSR